MFNMFLYFTKVYNDCKEHHLECISCPESVKRYQLSLKTSDGHCLSSVQLTRSCHFCLSNAMYSSIGQNIKPLACPVSNVWCLVSGVRCPMSDVQHAYFQFIPRYEQEISVRARVDEILV